MVIYPLLWVVMSSFKDDSEVIREPLSADPDKLQLGELGRAWTEDTGPRSSSTPSW